MTRSIGVIILILFLVVAGFAYWNYDRLNQIQDNLLEKDIILEESKQLIEKQEESITQLEEQIKESSEQIQTVAENDLGDKPEEIITKQLSQFQEEMDELKEKLEMAIEQNNVESQNISQLKEEKENLEKLLAEREAQWQAREEESNQTIASLQDKIDTYETNIDSVNNRISELDDYLESEITIRKDLEQEIALYQERINSLQEKLAITQDDETQVQLMSQLQASKEGLEHKIEQKIAALEEVQEEYKLLQKQLTEYKQEIAALHANISAVEEDQKKIDEIQSNLVQLREEKNKLEDLLAEREAQWQAREEESNQMITLLQEEVGKYESNLKEIGGEMLSLQKNFNQQVSFKERLTGRIELLSEEIDDLKDRVTEYREAEHSYMSVLNQLQSDNDKLREQLEKEGAEINEERYQQLLTEVNLYHHQLEELEDRLADSQNQDLAITSTQIKELEDKIEVFERLLSEKEEIWARQNKENKDLITYLKKQLEEYQEEIEVVRIDSSLFKEEIATQMELQQERIGRINDREEQIAALTSEIEVNAKKIEEYVEMINQLRSKLQQQENLSYREKQEILDDLMVLLEERDSIQRNVTQCHNQIIRLESEIVELQNKLAILEEEKEEKYYEVKSGDCLWNIAKNKYNEGTALLFS